MGSRSGKTRNELLRDSAAKYGDAALRNYVRIRSLAERICEGFGAFLEGCDGACVYLVPPKGEFSPRDFGSAAFSVSGENFLPLGPISFGLALKVSDTGDWLRIVVTAMQEGGDLVCTIKDGETFEFPAPLSEASLQELLGHLYDYARAWFEERVTLYESGAYGGSTMGFDLLHIDTHRDAAAIAPASPPEHEHAPPEPLPLAATAEPAND